MSIETMKQALEALENTYALRDDVIAAKESLRQAIAEAEKHEVSQEPVAWLYESPMPDNSMFVGASVERLKIGIGVTPDTIETPLYTHPYVPTERQPKREWVGLTIGETAIIVKMLERGNFIVAIAAVQAKLKQKNT